jgi:hypothetical protein
MEYEPVGIANIAEQIDTEETGVEQSLRHQRNRGYNCRRASAYFFF